MRSLVRFSFAVMAALLLGVAFSAPQSAMAQTDQPGVLVISEARFSGPGGATDEYVEICNPNTATITVVSSDGSGGFGLYARNPFGGVFLVFTIPNGTVIQGGRCVLGTGGGYSLTAYPGGEGPFQAQTSGQLGGPTFTALSTGGTEGVRYTGDIQDNTGIALFTSNNVVFSGATFGPASSGSGQTAQRLDAFGFRKLVSATSEPAEAAIFREGVGLIPYGSDLTANQYAYVRMNNSNSDTKKDTNDNVADFYNGQPVATGYGGTNANIVHGTTTTSAGAGELSVAVMLGAPGPQDLGAPRNRRFSEITGAFNNFDATAGSLAPNRERNANIPTDTGCGGTFADNVRCAPQGTFSLRITYTNNTGAAITALRFRINDLSTVNRGLVVGPSESAQAILRAIDSLGGPVFVNSGADYADTSGTRFAGGSTTGNAGYKFANGLAVERFPPQPNGGGVNSAWVFNPCSNQTNFPATVTATGSGTASPRSSGGLGTGTCTNPTASFPGGTTPTATSPTVGAPGILATGPYSKFSVEYRFGVQRGGNFLFLVTQEAN